jgi:hypothetical protein
VSGRNEAFSLDHCLLRKQLEVFLLFHGNDLLLAECTALTALLYTPVGLLASAYGRQGILFSRSDYGECFGG